MNWPDDRRDGSGVEPYPRIIRGESTEVSRNRKIVALLRVTTGNNATPAEQEVARRKLAELRNKEVRKKEARDTESRPGEVRTRRMMPHRAGVRKRDSAIKAAELFFRVVICLVGT